MKWKITNRRAFLTLVSVITLVVGLGSAVWIYRTAGNDSNNILGYEARGGSIYPVMPEDSKKFMRDLEQFGGKTNVLLYEFRVWFVGLWQGKSLAYMVACISVFLSLMVYAAGCLSSGSESESRGENNQNPNDENTT
jgi:hypothetical protein